jgi:quercetin dioxygenase-like cupin family protein
MAREQLWFLDTLVTVHVARAGNADGISVLESAAPHGDSAPLHVHDRQDEVFHVLEGELLLRVAGDDLRLTAGQSAVGLKGIEHTYRVESVQGARWLAVTTGEDFENFVRKASRPAPSAALPPPAGPPTPEQQEAFARLAEQHGIRLLGPPLG